MKRLFSTALALFLAGFCFLPGANAEGPSRRERLQWAAEARERFAEKNFTAAADSLEKAAAPGASKGDLLGWQPLLGRCYEALKNYQKALTVYQAAYRLAPRSVERMLDLARVYSQVELYEQAIDLYKSVLKKEKNRKDARLVLAHLYFKTRQLDAAKREALRYSEWEPRDVAAQNLLVQIEIANGDFDSAAHRWESVLAQEPSADGYFQLGRLWLRLDEFDLADRAFQRAETMGTPTAELFTDRGLVAWRQNKRDLAADYWKKAEQLDPAWPLAPFFLALNDLEAGKTESAVEHMRRVEMETGNDYVKSLARRFLEIVAASSGGK